MSKALAHTAEQPPTAVLAIVNDQAGKTDATLRNAAIDFNSLAEVFGWLGEILRQIADLSSEDDEHVPGVRLMRIKALANCANYLSLDWQSTAENMAESIDDGAKQ